MIYYVYLIINLSNNKAISYVGFTNNLEKRINKHNNSKGAKFTRGRHWNLIYFKKYKSKKKALYEEWKLKKDYNRRRIIKNDYLKKC